MRIGSSLRSTGYTHFLAKVLGLCTSRGSKCVALRRVAGGATSSGMNSWHTVGLTTTTYIVSVFPASVARRWNLGLEGPFLELHISSIDTSNMTSYVDSHTVSLAVSHDSEQFATETTTFSPNGIVKDYIATRSAEFRKLDDLRSLVSPRCTHIVCQANEYHRDGRKRKAMSISRTSAHRQTRPINM